MSDHPEREGSRGGAPSGESTRSVHGGERRHRDSHAVTTPIHQTSTFWFEDSQAVIDYNEGRNPRDEYGRYGNPTWRAVERKLSELDGGEAALCCDSLRRNSLTGCDPGVCPSHRSHYGSPNSR